MKINVLVLGASENPQRYSNKAMRSLVAYGHEVFAIGLKPVNVAGVAIQTNWKLPKPIHTISLYLGASRQTTVIDNILATNPKRIIFNPGTENPELEQRAMQQGITVVHDCTLVMLANNYFADEG